jgi:hypothetical protein
MGMQILPRNIINKGKTPSKGRKRKGPKSKQKTTPQSAEPTKGSPKRTTKPLPQNHCINN